MELLEHKLKRVAKRGARLATGQVNESLNRCGDRSSWKAVSIKKPPHTQVRAAKTLRLVIGLSDLRGLSKN